MTRRLFLMSLSATIACIFYLGCSAGSLSERTESEESVGQTLDLTLENIYLNQQRVRQAAVSPDGGQLAVTVSSNEAGGIYLFDVQSGDSRFLIQGSSPAWNPDGSGILFSRSGDLWITSLDNKEPLQVTRNVKGLRSAAFSPDGSSIAFYSTESGSQDIWVVGSDGESNPRKLTDGAMPMDDSRFAPAWSPDGKKLAFVSCKSDYSSDDVWLVEVDSGMAKQLSRSIMATCTPVWSPNGKQIALHATAKDEYWYEDLSRIYILDPLTGSEETVEMQVYATDSGNRHKLHWSQNGQSLYFLYMERGNTNLWNVSGEGGVATRVTNMVGSIGSFVASPDAELFAFVRSTPTRGSDVYIISAKGGEAIRITHFSTEWRNVRAPEEISYKSFDGMYIQGFLYTPPGFDRSRQYPTIVQVHGGGTNSYVNGLNLTEQYLASKGYVVLAINYRGGSGFGREYQDLSIGDWANGQALDAGAAADFLRSLPYSNGKVGIYGYSYGGIMTMATIARVPGKFDAAVPMAGIYDFADAQETADRVGKLFVQTGHLGTPEEKPDAYEISNTLARIKNIDTPLLIMHGEADVRAPFRQYELAVEELRRHGKEFESKSYPNEPHGFRNPLNRIDMYQRLEAFFNERLKASQ